MSDNTGIEWTDATWNPVTGCDKVSAGCDHCYAETIAHRFAGTPAYPHGFAVTLRPERLDQPLRWRRPRRIFVNSMSDLFHKDVPDDYIARVFAVMARAQRHTFQVLTKRPGRMRSLLSSPRWAELLADAPEWPAAFRNGEPYGLDIDPERPLDNVWLGVSVEDQHWADVRIPVLLETPAAVRFLSCEPLLAPVDLGDLPHDPPDRGIGWVIVGGESGPGARPMHPDWARSLRDQCQAAGVAFLFKQWGAWSPNARNSQISAHRFQYESIRFRPTGERYTPADVDNRETGWNVAGMESLIRVPKKMAGRELDGRTWDEYPDLVAEPV